MKTIEQIALETNDKLDKPFFYDHGAIDFAKEFLAAWLEQSQEPVAWMGRDGEDFSYKESSYFTKPLFLAPQPATLEGYVLVPKEPSDV